MFFFKNAASTWPPNYRGVSYSVASHRAARHTLVVCGQLDAIKHFCWGTLWTKFPPSVSETPTSGLESEKKNSNEISADKNLSPVLCRCHRDDIKSVTKKQQLGIFFKRLFSSVSAKNAPTWPQFLCKCVTPFFVCFWTQNWQKKMTKKIPTVPTVTGSSCSIYLTEKSKNYYSVQCTIDERWALHLHRWRWGGESVTREFMNIFPFLFCCVWVLYQVLYLRCVQMRSDSFAGWAVSFDYVALLHPISQWVLFPFSFCCGHNAWEDDCSPYPLQYSLWHISFWTRNFWWETTLLAVFTIHRLVSFEILSLFLIICNKMIISEQ